MFIRGSVSRIFAVLVSVRQGFASSSLLFLLVYAALTVRGQNTPNTQDAAQKAIRNEPEFLQSMQILDAAAQNGNNLQKIRALQQARALWDQLEARLNSDAFKCNLCASNQDELSAFIRDRMGYGGAMSAPLGMAGGSNASGYQKMLGLVPLNPTRWDDLKVAEKEDDSIYLYCRENSKAAACGLDSTENAAAHERAWAKCFQEHDWVRDSSRRKAYDACMIANDPLTQACAARSGKVSDTYSCPGLLVRYYDVDHLRNYRDRWADELRKDRERRERIAKANADPNHLEVAGEVYDGEPLHITLLEPVVVPATREAEVTIHVQLENPIEALMGRIGGLGNNGIWRDAGTRMEMKAKLTAAPDNSGGVLQLSLPDADRDLDFQLDGWPTSGTVIFPVRSSLSFATKRSDSTQTMSVAELQARYAARKSYEKSFGAAGIPPFITRPILSGSEFQATLQEPINVKDVRAGRDFHAKLLFDMMLPRSTGNMRNDAIQLKRGTDVYLKVTNQPSSVSRHYYALLSVDYVVWNGQKVPVGTSIQKTAWEALPRRPRPIFSRDPSQDAGDRVLWSLGASLNFAIVNQVEVPTGSTGSLFVAGASGPASSATPAITPANNVGGTSAAPVTSPAIPDAETPQPIQTVAGAYVGRFRCGLVNFDLRLTVSEAGAGALTAVFDYSPLLQQAQQRFIFDMAGKEETSSHQFELTPVRWETGHPPHDQMVAMKGTWDPGTRRIEGRLSNMFCGKVHLSNSEPPSNTPQPNTPQRNRSRFAKK